LRTDVKGVNATVGGALTNDPRHINWTPHFPLYESTLAISTLDVSRGKSMNDDDDDNESEKEEDC